MVKVGHIELSDDHGACAGNRPRKKSERGLESYISVRMRIDCNRHSFIQISYKSWRFDADAKIGCLSFRVHPTARLSVCTSTMRILLFFKKDWRQAACATHQRHLTNLRSSDLLVLFGWASFAGLMLPSLRLIRSDIL